MDIPGQTHFEGVTTSILVYRILMMGTVLNGLTHSAVGLAMNSTLQMMHSQTLSHRAANLSEQTAGHPQRIISQSSNTDHALNNGWGLSSSDFTSESEADGYRCGHEQYWDEARRTCRNCTTCYPGTGLDSHEPCGHGYGTQLSCRPCQDGFYQAEVGHRDIFCHRCTLCAQEADVKEECTRNQNTRCGPCPLGMFYLLPNVCEDCKSKTDHADCSALNLPVPQKTNPPSSPPLSSSPPHSSSSPVLPSSLDPSILVPTNEIIGSVKLLSGPITITLAVLLVMVIGVAVFLCFRKKKCGSNAANVQGVLQDYKSVIQTDPDKTTLQICVDCQTPIWSHDSLSTVHYQGNLVSDEPSVSLGTCSQQHTIHAFDSPMLSQPMALSVTGGPIHDHPGIPDTCFHSTTGLDQNAHHEYFESNGKVFSMPKQLSSV